MAAAALDKDKVKELLEKLSSAGTSKEDVLQQCGDDATAKGRLLNRGKEIVADQAKSFLKGVIGSIFAGAANTLPFGSIAVSLCEGVIDRHKAIKTCKEEAARLLTRVRVISKRSDAIVSHFNGDGGEMDPDDRVLVEELMEKTFFAFRLISDLQPKDKQRLVGKTFNVVLHFLGAADTREALDSTRSSLAELSGTLALAISTDVSNKQQRQPLSTATKLPAGVPPMLAKCTAAEDAISFWVDNGFAGVLLIPVDTLVDALVFAAEQSGKEIGDEDALELAMRSILSKKGRDTTSVQLFVKLLGDASTVVEAVQRLAATSAMANASGDEILAELRKILNPESFGADLSRHNKQFWPGTRDWVFQDIENWAEGKDSNGEPLTDEQKRSFWLQGTGGLGKTVLAAQFVLRYGSEQSRDEATQPPPLAICAHFFCKHDSKGRNDPLRAVCTLAFRLASMLPGMASALRDILGNTDKRAKFEAHATGAKGSVSDAFDLIVARPLKTALESQQGPPRDVFILIDALDELEEGSSRSQFLDLVGNQLVNLPRQVRLIITSRPETDIVERLHRLTPYKLQRQEERQSADLQLYIKEAVVDGSVGLAKLSSTDQEEAAACILEAADGVFLAARLCREEVQRLEDDVAGNNGINLAGLKTLLNASGANFIDKTYATTLARINERLVAVTADDDGAKDALLLALRRMLAVLVASQAPLFARDLAELSSAAGVHQSAALTKQLLASLSLLFSAPDKQSPIQPLHKTVFDFLTDAKRSGEHFVDVNLGHRLLANNCRRAMEAAFLRSSGSVSAEQVRHSTLLVYAARFGHQHLKCLAEALFVSGALSPATFSPSTPVSVGEVPFASTPPPARRGLFAKRRAKKEQRRLQHASKSGGPASASSSSGDPRMVPSGLDPTIASWLRWWLEPREIMPPTHTDSHPASPMQASQQFGCWLMLEIERCGRLRKLHLEIAVLAQALGVDGIALRTLLSDTAQLLTRDWLPHADKKSTGGCLQMVTASMPATFQLHDSKAQQHMYKVLGISMVAVMSLPKIMALDNCITTFLGHVDSVNSVAFSPDGKQLVSGGEDKTIKLWSVATGQCMATLEGHGDIVNSVAFSPDGKHVASGGDDKTIKLWSVASGKCKATLAGHGDVINSVVFSPDGRQLASGSMDKTIKLWSVASGKCESTFEGHSDQIKSVAFSPDGKQLASSSFDGTIKLWTVASGQCEATLQGQGRFINSVAFSPDGKQLASGNGDNTIKVWSVASGQCEATLEGHSDEILSLTFSPDGKQLASSFDRTIKVWSVAGGQCEATLEGHICGVYAVAFSPDGKQLASSSWEGSIKLWSVSSSGQSDARTSTPEGHGAHVSSVALRPDGKQLASGSGDNTIKLWSVISGQCEATLEGQNSVISVAYSPNGKLLASCCESKAIKLWSTTASSGGQCEATLDGHEDSVTSVTFSPDGKQLASSGDDTVKLWSVASGQCEATFEGHNGCVMSAAFSPDGKQLASGCTDKTIKLWSVTSGQCEATLEGHGDVVNSVAFSPDGKLLASCSDDNTIKLWSVASGQCEATLEGHNGTVSSAAFSPDGNQLASGSFDETIKLWSVAGGKCEATLEGHSNLVMSVAFSSDGQQLASGSYDKSIKLWQR